MQRASRERPTVHGKPFPKHKRIRSAFLTQGPTDHSRGERSRTCKRQSLPCLPRLPWITDVTSSL